MRKGLKGKDIGSTPDITTTTLGEFRKQNPNFKFVDYEEMFYEAQQYYSLWYSGSKAFQRLDPASLSHSSYVVFELYSLRKEGKDLSKLTIGELDEMSFQMSSTWFKIDSAALLVYGGATMKGTGNVNWNLNNLKNTDVFKKGTTSNALNHIFEGEIIKGQAVVFHYEGMPNSKGKIIGNVDPPNKYGVYRANIEVDGILKKAKTTFFPKDWTPQQVIDEINIAFNNNVV